LNLFTERAKSKIAAKTCKTDFFGIKTKNFKIKKGYKKLKKKEEKKI
jgi:hypothetical protein